MLPPLQSEAHLADIKKSGQSPLPKAVPLRTATRGITRSSTGKQLLRKHPRRNISEGGLETIFQANYPRHNLIIL